jgi:hypothetical protein
MIIFMTRPTLEVLDEANVRWASHISVRGFHEVKRESVLVIVVDLFLMIQLLIVKSGEGSIHLSFVLRLLRVTVLIINRNRANLLSSITQWLPDIEIIVTDDASTDSSVAVISAFAE